MPSSRIPSPARSQGAKHTPRRHKPRVSRSVGSPARSDTSVKLSAVVQMDWFALSPMPTRRSVLTDTTDIDIPRRKSWWKKLDESSREIMDVINTKETPEANNAIEEYIDVDVLSQEKKNYTLDLPDSSDGESINSIVIPQRKLFTQKDSQNQNKFGQFMDNRDTLGKLHKTQAIDEQELNVGPKNLFNQGKKQKSKPIFPSALLNISANKTLANKTKELPPKEPKGQVKSLFGNRPGTKRKNIFTDFIVSESEDEISEIQPKVFEFQKKLAQKNLNSRGAREQSPTSSVTDIEMDDWRLLPSSTMVDHQLEDGLRTTPSKRARLSKLSEAVESVNTTANKTKQSNKTINSKSRSKNASKFNEVEENELISPTNDDELDTAAHNQNNSKNKSLSRTDGNSKNRSHDKSLKNQTSKNKEHSKSKNTTHMTTLNEDVVSEGIVNNEENKSNDGNKNNKSKQNKTSNTLTKIDEALQSDDDEDFTLEYENDDEAVENIENNKTIVENVAENSYQCIKNINSNSNSENINISKQMQHKTKNQSVIQDSHSQANKNEITINKRDEMESNKKGKSFSSEVDTNENNKNSSHNQDVESQRDISYNKSIRNQNNMSKNTSHKQKFQEDDVELNELEVENKLVGGQAESNEAIDNEQNNSKSNKIDECTEENQDDDDNDQEVSKNDELSDRDQGKSLEVENDEQNDPETDDEEQQDDVQNNQKVDDTNEDAEMIDDDKQDSQEEINNEDIEDENEEIEGENEEIEGDNEEIEDDNEEIEGENEEIDDENEEMEDENEEEVVEDEAAIVTDADNNDESQEVVGDDEESHAATDDNEDDGDISNDMQVNDDSQENVDDGEEEEMQESGQNDSQEVESEDEVPDEEDASDAEDVEQEVEDSDQNDEENVSQNEEEDETTENHEDEETSEENREEEIEQSDVQNESEEVIDDGNVNESEDEVDDHNESTDDERDTADIAEANETHDTTGRHRQQEQRVPSPEAILHDKTNQIESFMIQGRNTSVRKTKSMVRKNRSPSLAPVRESTGLSDGVRDSSGEGSGWDSHRTTRLTIRQTIGRDFTPRKSLRALVMEKSAKRHTNFTDTNADIRVPQANSTEFPRQESFDDDHHDEFDQEMPSDHEESRRMRQTTLEMYLQKVKEKNIERKKQLEDEIRSSLKAPTRDMLNPFKVPAVPKRTVRRVKPQSKANAKVKSVIPLNLLPAEVLEDMKYKPPKRYQPANASWITKRLYKFLETKLEPKYDYKSRVRSEKLVETLYNFTKDIRRLPVAPSLAVDALKQEMARLNIVGTHVEFYEFFHEYMPREVRVKVVPDVFNKISLPKHGVFSDILR